MKYTHRNMEFLEDGTVKYFICYNELKAEVPLDVYEIAGKQITGEKGKVYELKA